MRIMLRKVFLGGIIRHSRWFSAIGSQEQTHNPFRTNVTDELVSTFGHYRLVKKIIRKNPDLAESDIFFWKKFTTAMLKHGFRTKDCFHIIHLYPSVLGHDEDNLNSVLDEWKAHSHLAMDDLKFLLLNRPEFLTLTPGTIKNRLPFLLDYCKSKDSLMTLLFLCPNIMEDNWEEIMKKLQFLNDEMMVYRTEVFTCKALSKPLDFIKLRFSILEKCGIYTKPNPHLHKQTHKERLTLRNPPLKNITDKSDYTFARKIAKISLEEYEVYENLFYENDQENDDELSDSSDEE